MRRLCSLGCLLLAAHVLAAVPAIATDYAVKGAHLLARDSPTKPRFVVSARDKRIVVPEAGGDDDPTRVGGELWVTITTAAGVATVTFALPAEGWSRRDRSAGPSVRFANGEVPAGTSPVRAAVLSRGRFKAKALAAANFATGGAVLSVAVGLRSGSSSWCTLFSDRLHVGRGGTVTAGRQPEPPLACPSMASTSTTVLPTTTVTSPTTTVTTSTSTTTVPPCGCGDAVCQEGESQATCFADCRVERTPILPIIVGSCGLAAFQESGSCTDLPAVLRIDSIGPAPDGSCMWGWGEPSASGTIAVLPSECCYNGTCGGGVPAAARHIGDVVVGPTGNNSAILAMLIGCLDAGIDQFVVPTADCADLASSFCGGPATITGFATVRLLAVRLTGAPKGLDFEVLCTDDGPCGLGVCPADCGSCPVDCGGCAPPCS